MRLALVVLVLVGACRGRFDEVAPSDAEVADAPVDIASGHDEDGDGIADASDPCPHVAGTAADGDGDEIGDACDPEPMNPRQSWTLFDPLGSGTSFSATTGTWTATGDALRGDTSTEFGELIAQVAFQYGVLEIGGEIVSRDDAASQHQVALAARDAPTAPYYYAEVYDPGSSGYAALVKFDGMSYMPVAQTAIPGDVHTGSFVLRLAATPAQDLTVTATWPGEPYTTGLNAVDYAGGSRIGISAQGIVFELRYVAVIATN